jgi:hypothetical protein
MLNDRFFGEGLSMGKPNVAIVAYCVSVAFILVVAFHSPSEMLITASVPAITPASELK